MIDISLNPYPSLVSKDSREVLIVSSHDVGKQVVGIAARCLRSNVG